MPKSLPPRRVPPRRASVAAFLAAALAVTGGAADASDGQEERDVRAAFSALHEDDAFHDCVAPERDAAFAAMWSGRAPLESAVAKVSAAYRSCDGFITFWNAIYVAGYRSPEAWIADELELARRAVLAQAEIDEGRLAEIADELATTVTGGFQELEVPLEQIQGARALYIQFRYIAEALEPAAPPLPALETLAADFTDLAAAPLPPDASLELKDADALAALDVTAVLRRGRAALPAREEDE